MDATDLVIDYAAVAGGGAAWRPLDPGTVATGPSEITQDILLLQEHGYLLAAVTSTSRHCVCRIEWLVRPPVDRSLSGRCSRTSKAGTIERALREAMWRVLVVLKAAWIDAPARIDDVDWDCAKDVLPEAVRLLRHPFGLSAER